MLLQGINDIFKKFWNAAWVVSFAIGDCAYQHMLRHQHHVQSGEIHPLFFRTEHTNQ